MDKAINENVQSTHAPPQWHAENLFADRAQPAFQHDASKLINGIGCGVVREASGFIDFLATPNAVGDAMMAIGPQLDNVVNYYGQHLAQGTASEIGADVTNTIADIKGDLRKLWNAPLEQKGELFGAVIFNIALAEAGAAISRVGWCAELPEQIESNAVSISRGAAGKGGGWPVLNERPSPDVVRQSEMYSCPCACGEMLSEGKITEAELKSLMLSPDVDGANPLALAKHLGPDWTAARYNIESLPRLLQHSPLAVELRDLPPPGRYSRADLGHVVVVDGLDEVGNIRIRDPKHGSRYEMIPSDFINHWTGAAIWRQ